MYVLFGMIWNDELRTLFVRESWVDPRSSRALHEVEIYFNFSLVAPKSLRSSCHSLEVWILNCVHKTTVLLFITFVSLPPSYFWSGNYRFEILIFFSLLNRIDQSWRIKGCIFLSIIHYRGVQFAKCS